MLFQMQESKYLTAAAAVFCSTWLLLCCCKLAISQEQATPDCHKSKLNVSLVEWDLNLITLLASLTVSNIVINFLLTDKISNHQMARNFGIGLSRAQLQIKCCGMPSNMARNLINYRKPEERESKNHMTKNHYRRSNSRAKQWDHLNNMTTAALVWSWVVVAKMLITRSASANNYWCVIFFCHYCD